MLTVHATCSHRRPKGVRHGRRKSGGCDLGSEGLRWPGVGRRAELRTAQVLDRLASQPGGPTVLHDLAIPIPNISANIDHVVVSGRRVLIVDSKGWRPARYRRGRFLTTGHDSMRRSCWFSARIRETQDVSAIRLIAASVRGIPS